jgi:hypothetical protein
MRSIIYAASFSVANFFSSATAQEAKTNPPGLEVLEKRIAALETKNAESDSKLNGVIAAQEAEAKARFNKLRGNVIAATRLLATINSGSAILQSKAKGDSVGNFITQLNSPAGDLTGINLQSILEEEVRRLDLSNAKKARLIAGIQTIIKSPLVLSIPSVAPAVAVISSAMDLIRSVSFVENTEQSRITEFEGRMNKYVAFYLALNDGRAGFSYDLKYQTDEISALQEATKQHAIRLLSHLDLKAPPVVSSETDTSYISKLVETLSEDAIREIFEQVTEKHTIGGKVGYVSIMNDKGHKLVAAGQLVDGFVALAEQFEVRFKSFEGIYELYSQRVAKALEVASTNKIGDLSKIEKSKDNFKSLTSASAVALKEAVNLGSIYKIKSSIQR